MLSPAEQDLVRRDPRLPGLATLLDADAFRNALGRATPGVDLRAARLRYLRYKPGQNCLAAYTLDVGGAAVDCHAKAHRRGDAGKLAKAAQRPNHPGPIGQGRSLWPDVGIEVCVFPNDNKLGSLGGLVDAARREDMLQRHLPQHPALWRCTLRPLAYKPERRWVGALESEGVPLAVCKLYGDTAFEIVRSKAKRFVHGDVLRLAPLLGRSTRRGALFFGWQTGQLLSQAMLETSFDPKILFRVGVALGELQRQSPAGLPVRSPQRDAESLFRLGEFLGFLLPAEADRLRAVAGRLAPTLGGLPAELSVVHGDFYAKQVLFSGGTIAVLDLDEAVQGDPQDDLGTFLAHVEREVILGRLGAGSLATFQAQLLEGYRAGGGSWDPTRLQVHTAVHLFGRLPHFFRNHDEAWVERTRQSLDRIETLLERAVRTAPVRPALDLRLPALEQALEARSMESRLNAVLNERDPGVAQATLRQVTLLRHKPGRRALIEYRLERRRDGKVESLSLLGKLRRRGVDGEILGLWRQLSADGFGPASPDGLSIPELVGVVPVLGMTLQQRVEAPGLAGRLLSSGGARAARRAAEALSKLHQSRLKPGRTHTMTEELALLHDRLTAVAAAFPAWQNRLTALLETCRRLASSLPPVPRRPIHRDFYHDQLLLDDDRVWLLDLDLLCAGDPALDAGNFVGHLIEWGVRAPADRAALDAAAEAFERRFLELSGVHHQAAISLYTTLALARHIHISTRFPERAPFTAEILQQCEARCGLTSATLREPLFPDMTP